MDFSGLVPHAEVVGALAAVLTSISFLPQVWKTVKSRHADDFSWGWLAAFGAGVAMWAFYGLILEAPSIILNNILVWLCVAVMAWIKFTARK